MLRAKPLLPKQVNPSPKRSVIFLLVFFGVIASLIVVRIRYSIKHHPKQTQGDLDRALIHAIRKEAEAEVLDLLKRGAHLNAQFEDVGSLPDASPRSHFPLLNEFRSMFRVKKEYRVRYQTNALNEALNRSINHQRAPSNETIVTALVQAGADVNADDDNGWVPLLYAADAKQCRIIKLLLDHGAKLNRMEPGLGSALSRAAMRGDAISVSLLIRRGANVNAANAYGRTSLMEGVLSNDTKTVRLLLEGGALLRPRNSLGRDAMSYALENRQPDIIKLMQKYSTHPASKSNTHVSQ